MQKVLTDACQLMKWRDKRLDKILSFDAEWCAFYEPIKENENESKTGSGQGDTSENKQAGS